MNCEIKEKIESYQNIDEVISTGVDYNKAILAKKSDDIIHDLLDKHTKACKRYDPSGKTRFNIINSDEYTQRHEIDNCVDLHIKCKICREFFVIANEFKSHHKNKTCKKCIDTGRLDDEKVLVVDTAIKITGKDIKFILKYIDKDFSTPSCYIDTQLITDEISYYEDRMNYLSGMGLFKAPENKNRYYATDVGISFIQKLQEFYKNPVEKKSSLVVDPWKGKYI